MLLKDIAVIINAKLKGNPNCEIRGLASLEKADAQDLSFLINRHYRPFLKTTQAAAILLTEEDIPFYLDNGNVLISLNPKLSLAKIARLFESKTSLSKTIHPTVIIGEGCQIASSVSIGPGVVLGQQVTIGEEVVIGAGCIIGDGCIIQSNTVLKPRVTLYEKVHLGKSCVIHSGAVLGSNGFGYAYDNGSWIKMPDLGNVHIGDHVEIGANTTIDRGFLEDTKIGDGAIIDNLVQVGHNVTIGSRTAIAACVAIAGSTHIGADCLIGGAACISGHLEIADKVSITATSGVNHSISQPGVYSAGLPAKPNHIWRKNAARFQYLDDMARRIRALEVMQKEAAKGKVMQNAKRESEVE